MFKTILVTLDLNHPESWEDAQPLAVKLAKESDAALHISAVVPDFGAAMVQGYFPANFEAQTLQRAEADLEKIVEGAVPADMPRTLHLDHGSIREKILRRAESCGADLIVMASHAPEQLREFLVGSYADWIVRHAPISVLVVRSKHV
jgi:nucleotide-binding universal stress UspA family protein